MSDETYETLTGTGGKPVKSWTRGVPFDDKAREQLLMTASLPFIHQHVAAMPDVHVGIGATVGSVVATHKAIIPAAVGVDIGCGMMAAETTLTASDLPDGLAAIRSAIERAVPHGKAGWKNVGANVVDAWSPLRAGYDAIVDKHPQVKGGAVEQLGTLGGGNHFIELCLDERDHVWIMLHSGSRGVGNRIGTYFIELARKDLQRHFISVPHRDLAYFTEGAEHFADYVEAVGWAQDYARRNRELMMVNVVDALRPFVPPFAADVQAVNCHHHYVEREHHFGEDVFVTRKGAVRARVGDMGIIPGSMGAKSFIVRGKGNPDSFHSCSHGAGRTLSRGEAKRRFTIEDHIEATKGIECRKDAHVIDETPGAYKSIDAVMAAQADLVEVAHTLRQVVCVKG